MASHLSAFVRITSGWGKGRGALQKSADLVEIIRVGKEQEI